MKESQDKINSKSTFDQTYNSLSDHNLMQYFENKDIQKHLWRTGQVSSTLLKLIIAEAYLLRYFIASRD